MKLDCMELSADLRQEHLQHRRSPSITTCFRVPHWCDKTSSRAAPATAAAASGAPPPPQCLHVVPLSSCSHIASRAPPAFAAPPAPGTKTITTTYFYLPKTAQLSEASASTSTSSSTTTTSGSITTTSGSCSTWQGRTRLVRKSTALDLGLWPAGAPQSHPHLYAGGLRRKRGKKPFPILSYSHWKVTKSHWKVTQSLGHG